MPRIDNIKAGQGNAASMRGKTRNSNKLEIPNPVKEEQIENRKKPHPKSAERKDPLRPKLADALEPQVKKKDTPTKANKSIVEGKGNPRNALNVNA